MIESFYGPLWSIAARTALVWMLAPAGYAFYWYAPKRDPHTRTAWRTPWPPATEAALQSFAETCRAAGVRFGAGLAPIGLDVDAPAAAWHDLNRRVAQLDALGVDDLVLAFDDMRGDTPGLADTQARIADHVAARSAAERIAVCPTYVSDDPLLDRLFGPRPAGYLARLGAALDRAIDVFWTGEEVCARAHAPAHFERVGTVLGRRPLLWDNYPVNDTPVMARHLHLRAFTGRPPELAEVTAGHAINPALQPTLSAIPALTLPLAYHAGRSYAYTAAFRDAARQVCGDDLAARLQADLPMLCDWGRDRLAPTTRDALRARYAVVDHVAAREVVAWLDGAYDPGDAAAPA